MAKVNEALMSTHRKRWRLYGEIGSCRWMEMRLNDIGRIEFVSATSKSIANEMLALNAKLKDSLTQDIEALKKETAK